MAVDGAAATPEVRVKSSWLTNSSLLLSSLTAALALPSAISSALPNLIQWGGLVAFIVANYRRFVTALFDGLPFATSQITRDVVVVSALTFLAVNVESIQRNRRWFVSILWEVFWRPVRTTDSYEGVLSVTTFLPRLMFVLMSAPLFLALGLGALVVLLGNFNPIDIAVAVSMITTVLVALHVQSGGTIDWLAIGGWTLMGAYLLAGAVFINATEEKPRRYGFSSERQLKERDWPLEILFVPARLVFVLPIFLAVAIANSLRTVLLTAGALTLLLVINEAIVRLGAQSVP